MSPVSGCMPAGGHFDSKISVGTPGVFATIYKTHTHNFFVWRYTDQIYCYDRADGCFEVQVFIFAEIYPTTDLTGPRVL